MFLTTLSAIALVFNELMAANVGTVMSPATNFDSWVEIYNPTDQGISLAGMYLSDDPANLTRWQMPDDVGMVPAKGYKVVWLGSSDIKTSQAPFKLDCDGGTICLSNADGQLVASERYPQAMSRVSWARKADGTGEWGWTADATPEASNATAVFASERLAPPVVSMGSKLFTASLSFEVDIPEGATLMYTTDGSVPTAPKGQEDAASPWTEWVKNGDCEGDDATCLVGKSGNENGKMLTHFTDGAGYDGSRGIVVHAVANAAEEWTTQFFVYTPDHTWNAGDRYRFSMRIRAERPCEISVQSHKTPGSYIYWSMLNGKYKITTEWQEITYEGTISNEQAGSGGGGWWGEPTPSQLQTIAFNLNLMKDNDNDFYIDDVSWQSYQGEGESTEAAKQSKDGKFTVTGTTNYCFRLFKDGYLPSQPVTRSYIKTSDHYTIPVVSIVGNKKYFTDPKTGIDCDGDGTNGKTGNGQDVPRNYNQPWDRPVNFSYIGSDGEMLFNQDVNISVSGGWTRSQRNRSFKLKANKVFDGVNHMDYAFFEQKPYIRCKGVLVRNGGNDLWVHSARFMDPALETIIQRSGIDLDVQAYQPVIEYVNGELRGVLNLRELNNDKFVYANYGYDDDEIDMFENFQMKQGTDSVIKRIFELGKQINEPGAYDELKTLLDIDEFTNYMASELFLNNEDWPDNNIKAYRSQNNGRYRFISFDLDYAFALMNKGDDDPFAHLKKYKYMDFITFFHNLLGHDDYRRKFVDTFCLMGGSVFESSRANAIVDELLNRVQPMNQLMGWNTDGNSPERAAATIKEKLSGRAAKMATCMQNYSAMQLANAKKHTATLQADTEGARLFVNGIEVPYSNFKGTLFAPVTIEAKAPAGYEFAGWKQAGKVYATNAKVDIPESAGTVSLTATFTKIPVVGNTQLPPLRINEVSAANGIYVNEYFKHNDWVELYNTTDEPIDAEGMYLSDNPNKPLKYQIVGGVAKTIVPAHGHLVVWCDKLEAESQLHASFKLAAEGGDVLLTAADESWCDRFAYSYLRPDETAGRYPDGTDDVFVMNVPTISRANLTSSYLLPIEQPQSLGVEQLQASDGNRPSPLASPAYNLMGQKVSASHRGLVLRNGRKYINR